MLDLLFVILFVFAIIIVGTAALMLAEWLIMGIAYLFEIMFKGIH